jgi:hypothetical protein
MLDAHKILDAMTFIEWQMIAFFGNIGLPKRPPKSGHVSLTTNPIRNDKKKRGRKPRALPKTPSDF